MRPNPATVVPAECRFVFKRPMSGWRGWMWAVLCSVTMLGTIRAGTTVDLDRDNGLPDAQLGAPLKSFPGLNKIEDTGRWLSYTRPADKLGYGGHAIKGITYNFFKERLYSIALDVEDKGNVKGLLKTLEKQYSKQHSYELHTYPGTAAQLEIREWAGAKVYCVYKNAADFRGGVLIFLDKPTWDLLQVPKKEIQAQTREMLKGSYLNGDF